MIYLEEMILPPCLNLYCDLCVCSEALIHRHFLLRSLYKENLDIVIVFVNFGFISPCKNDHKALVAYN